MSYNRGMVNIDVMYEGELHCTAVHGPSSSQLSTDAPVDNHGRGASFSPTDLVATALGTCMATVMGILARKESFPIEGAKVHVGKEMTSSGPRRIARLPVKIQMPEKTHALSAAARGALENAANHCPVRLSLLDAIDVPVEFVWPA